ncbi:MAG: LysR family transcriptional regulator [Steroidobacteraceae bacterium]|jgi:DNA-binding transcriptional LysR family regulator|nr:LysR family transcriptional regulator [Steroidobacteraceae bacterium]
MRGPDDVATLDLSPTRVMHLRYIEMFHAMLQAGTLTDAASLLNISQPAATKLLKQAERRLGFPLFVRVKGHWQLTPEGRLLQGKIERIFDELRDLQRLVTNISRADLQLLRAVTTPTLGNAVIPKSIAHLHRLVGQPSVELSTQHSREMLKSIVLREADVGFTLQRLSHPDVLCEPLCEGPLVLIAPKGTWSRVEATQPLAIASLADRPLIGIHRADQLGRQLEAYLAQLEPPARITTSVQTYQIARDIVCSGEGMALVDPFTAASALPDLQMRVVEPALPIELYAVYRSDESLNSVQRAFVNCVRAAATEMIGFLREPEFKLHAI